MNFKGIFGFAGWAGHNICWRWSATQDNFRDFGENADWRFDRYSTIQFLTMSIANGVATSALFGIPGFDLDMIVVDVLHALDLGVSQEAIGNLFFMYICGSYCTGSNRAEKLRDLWLKIKAYYKEAKPPTTLSSITMEMVRQQGKSPRLRAKAAETRHLVPFAFQLAQDMLAVDKSALNQTIYAMFKHLYTFYMTMGVSPYQKDLASSSARKFCLLYADVAKQTPDNLWKIKPKFHLFLELAEWQTESHGDPSLFWCYADETFVGMISVMAFSRGGKCLVTTTPSHVIDSYRAAAA